MKKLITTTAFLVFGTIFMTAQTTKKKDNTVRSAEKPANSTEMKMETQVQPNGMNRTIDTAAVNNRSKMQTNPNRIQQNQAFPNNGTLQNPNTTLPNNGTLQNPNSTMPNNSTTSPQVMPVSPVEGTKPNR
ncbi:hypothetical protein NG800_004230 [Epilithonimonas ginsengisoli]|uniref:Uncharacterized protein n=1 Tax=Epilithonimonas ginsengisoli TaxID=1245592 RepID=A0ABU4JEJ7_9FLAO|nr:MULTISPECIES: hypothetical protein [Chryseobacterium group]MBV6879468.1 hypothetical protein [Epilithonimonas sp. FP105]MDW8548104.1 hypothetical protein [Epilithonimonas ginsengisoli]OAH64457.1 hypothetical protein AXA65_19045 [Chryseobacterium sp. FP211-J200]